MARARLKLVSTETLIGKAHMKALIVIDPQNDFHEGGSLGIEGATADSMRTAELIRRHPDQIDHIFVSLDAFTSSWERLLRKFSIRTSPPAGRPSSARQTSLTCGCLASSPALTCG